MFFPSFSFSFRHNRLNYIIQAPHCINLLFFEFIPFSNKNSNNIFSLMLLIVIFAVVALLLAG